MMFKLKLRNFVFVFILGSTLTITTDNNANAQAQVILGQTSNLSTSLIHDTCSFRSDINVPSTRKPEEIRQLLAGLVDGKRATGIAVGWVTPQGRCVITAGSSGKTARPQIDGDTMFELGSITKGFTGTLLADMVAKGELSLDEPIGPYLPKAVQNNTALAALTFRQLTTHSSGLPRLPKTMAFAKSGMFNPLDPYANYSEANFVDDLANITLSADKKYEYSNLGVALLGAALARRGGASYSELVQRRLLDPINMRATSLVAANNDDALAAQPHDTSLKPTPGWNLGVFLPTGGMRSSVNDMMKLIDANLQRKAPWVSAHEQLAPLGKVGGVAYNWHIARLLSNIDGQDKRDTLVWHNGGTFGSTSFVGFDVERGIGMVVLINTGALGLADEIAKHLWDMRNPAPSVTTETKSISRIATLLIIVLVFTNSLLALHAYATLREKAATNRSSLEDSQTGKTAGKRLALRRMFFTPFVDRIDALTQAFSALAATLFILKFVPIIALVSNFGFRELLLAALALSTVYALWASRKVVWRIRRTLWQRVRLLFGVLLSTFFLWIAV